MSWITDQSNNRTYDSGKNLELFFVSGGSGGSQYLEIRGEHFCLPFSASLIAEPITSLERQNLGVPDAGVWRVYGKLTPEQRAMIVEAMSVTKMGHGFSPRNLPYFVRFEPKGELYGV
ncbi:hypothetical protein [Novosphingobium sp. CF614]|uniref:hypothetical protein n=1 Tax=Novosphingobium sp. CF614 TaxID=1884364 RepID=UPI00116041CA|nr:hypothetical protein [Novosphingobium sp. CF614]